MTTPALIIAGLSTGAGQEELMAALREHAPATEAVGLFSVGTPSADHHLLDPVMCGEELTRSLFLQASADAELALILGTAGLFDAPAVSGHSTQDINPGSAAHLAVLLGVPVVLVIDASGMAQTLGAVVKGVSTMDPDLRIQGIILQGCSSASHYERCRAAVEAQGLQVFTDPAAIISLAAVPVLPPVTTGEGEGVEKHPAHPVIALNTGAQADWAVQLHALGARVVDFDPATDLLPECDGLIIDGSLAPELGDLIDRGRPVYVQGEATWQLVAQFGLSAEAGPHDPGYYREAVSMMDSVFFPPGFRALGVDAAAAVQLVADSSGWQALWAWRDPAGRVIREGLQQGTVVASALRIHPAAVTLALRRFLDACSS